MLRSLLALALLLIAAACSPSRQAGADAGTPPPDFVVLFGRTGGMAGQMQGHTIRADGTVLRWDGKSPEERVQAEGRLDPDQMAALWARVQAAEVFSMQRQDMDPTVTFVTVTADGDSRRVAWHVPLGETPPDTPIQALYDDLVATALAALDA